MPVVAPPNVMVGVNEPSSYQAKAVFPLGRFNEVPTYNFLAIPTPPENTTPAELVDDASVTLLNVFKPVCVFVPPNALSPAMICVPCVITNEQSAPASGSV